MALRINFNNSNNLSRSNSFRLENDPPLTPFRKRARTDSLFTNKENISNNIIFNLKNKTLIGSGGLGKVYTLCDINGHEFAGKIHKKNCLFETEKETYTLLGEHPGIAKYYGSPKINGIQYLALEKVNGDNLRTFINNLDKYCIDRPEYAKYASALRLMVAQQLVSTLNFLKSKNISHSDLKPENIMINNEGKTKLIDFELARKTNQLHKGEFKGTINYMAHEALSGNGVDISKADDYALANILLEMLTGYRLSQNRLSYIHSRTENNREGGTVIPVGANPEGLSIDMAGPSGSFFVNNKKNPDPINKQLLEEIISPLHVINSANRANFQDIYNKVEEMAEKYLNQPTREKANTLFKDIYSYANQKNKHADKYTYNNTPDVTLLAEERLTPMVRHKLDKQWYAEKKRFENKQKDLVDKSTTSTGT